jgi:pimeloyl-ACP methyl ester carboxylesterase
MPLIKIRDVNIHYRIFGDIGPWLVLITGGRRGFNEFIPFAEKIAAKGFKVLLHDRRNTGASDVLIAGQDGEEEIWADDLDILLDELGASSAFIGGTSSGARLSMLFNQRHPDKVKGLMLMRVTGGDFAAGRLPEMYYGQFIRAAQQGGMKAVCETEQYLERIQANPSNLPRLMAMDPKEYIRVMEHWLSIFLKGPRNRVLGMEDDVLRAIRVPTLVIPGNDKTHASANGIAAARLIPNAILYQLPIEDQDIALLPFSDWEPYEVTLSIVLTEFMNKVLNESVTPPNH